MEFLVKGFENKTFSIEKDKKYLIRAIVPTALGSVYREHSLRVDTKGVYPQEVLRCPATIANGYDFGLDATSIDFNSKGNSYTDEDIEDMIDGRSDYIKSFKKIYGNKIDLSQKGNLEFWDKWKYEMYYDRIVETNSEKEFVDLCLAMRTGMIVPFKYQDTVSLKDRGWISIENISDKDENSQTTEARRIGIQVVLFKILTENKPLLCHILNYFDTNGEVLEVISKNEFIINRLNSLLNDANIVDRIYDALKIDKDYGYSIESNFKQKAEVTSMMKVLRYKGFIRKTTNGTIIGNRTLSRSEGDAIKEILNDAGLLSTLYSMYDDKVEKTNMKVANEVVTKKRGRKAIV